MDYLQILEQDAYEHPPFERGMIVSVANGVRAFGVGRVVAQYWSDQDVCWKYSVNFFDGKKFSGVHPTWMLRVEPATVRKCFRGVK